MAVVHAGPQDPVLRPRAPRLAQRAADGLRHLTPTRVRLRRARPGEVAQPAAPALTGNPKNPATVQAPADAAREEGKEG